MSQTNVNFPESAPPERDTGVGTVLAVLVVLAIVALLVWGLALGGFRAGTYVPTGSAPIATSVTGGTTNISPTININPPAPGGGTSGTSGTSGSTAPSTGTTGGTSGTTGGTTAPTKP